MEQVGFRVSFIAIIFIVLFFAFVVGLVSRLLAPRSNSGAGGWFALVGLALLGLVFLGFITVRVEHRHQPPMEVVAPMPHFVHAEPNIPLPPVAPTPPSAQAAGESIEEMWKRLTAPRINLEGAVETDGTTEPMGPSSPQELTQAAKVILSASLPGADPFTQGWLVNAAKSILGMPISAEEQAELHAAAREAAAALDATVAEAPAAPATPAEAAENFASSQLGVAHDAPLPQNSPLSKSKVSLDRPEWVVSPPKQIGNVRKFVVVSDPFVSVDECRRDADQKMQNLTLNRAAELSGADTARRAHAAVLEDLGLGADYARRELCTDEFVDVIDSSVGEMRQTYALLEFNETQDALLVDRSRAYSRQEGLQEVTLIGGGLLASVATLFGLLKVDTWTRGYYTKRLFLGVPAAIITVLTLFAAAGR